MKKTRKIVSVLLSLIMVIGVMSVAFVPASALVDIYTCETEDDAKQSYIKSTPLDYNKSLNVGESFYINFDKKLATDGIWYLTFEFDYEAEMVSLSQKKYSENYGGYPLSPCSYTIKAKKAGKTTLTYKVRYYNKKQDKYFEDKGNYFITINGGSSTPSITVPSAAAPTNVTMYNHDTGLHVDWYKAANASRYIVYYRPSWSSSWSSTTTSNTYCNLTGLTPGTLYYVQVRSVNSAGVNGGISGATSFTHVRGTKLNSTAYNSNGTVTIGWSSAPGANGYAIARKKSTDKSYTYYYVSGTSFTDKNVAGGALYYYQIRPYYSNGKSAAYAEWSNSKTITTLFKPTVTNMNATASRLNINWNAIKGATAYKVAFKRSYDSAWNFRTTTSRYYNVANPTQGATYQVQVCAINGSLAGAYSSVNTIKISSTPSSTTPSVNNTKPALTLSNKSNGIRVEWGAISGATSYVVYYKEVGYPDWSSVTTKNNYYPFLDAYVGESYFFQVLPMFGNTKGTFSSVYQLQFIPVINNNLSTTYLTNVYSSPLGLGVELNWNRVTSADGYVISRYCENDKSYNYFTLSGDGPCNKSDPFVKDGNTYVYWIRVYVESNGSRTYGPWSLSKRITYSKS